MALHPAVLMFIGHRYAEGRILEAVHAAGFELTVSQARLTARIAPGGSRATELAEQAQLTKQSAAALIDALERSGFVERVPDPSDARARLVRLAERGRRARRVARREERAIAKEWEAHLGKRRFTQLQESLESLRELVDHYR